VRIGDAVVGDHTLHLQCPWRLLQGGVVVTSDTDIPTPVTPGHTERWDNCGANKCDIRIFKLFEAAQYVVSDIRVEGLERAMVCMSEGLSLEVTPDEQDGDQWRILEPGRLERGHFVVDRIGGQLTGFWE
jgi:hypothetical protein